MPCKSSRLVGAVLGAHSSESCCSIRFRNQDCLREPTAASPRRDMSTTPTPLSYSPSPSLETNYRYNALQRCPRRGASQTKPEPCDSTHDFIAKHEPHHPYPPDPSDRIAHGRMTVTAHKQEHSDRTRPRAPGNPPSTSLVHDTLVLSSTRPRPRRSFGQSPSRISGCQKGRPGTSRNGHRPTGRRGHEEFYRPSTLC